MIKIGEGTLNDMYGREIRSGDILLNPETFNTMNYPWTFCFCTQEGDHLVIRDFNANNVSEHDDMLINIGNFRLYLPMIPDDYLSDLDPSFNDRYDSCWQSGETEQDVAKAHRLSLMEPRMNTGLDYNMRNPSPTVDVFLISDKTSEVVMSEKPLGEETLKFFQDNGWCALIRQKRD
jgi:hypothetical protein